MKKIKNDSQPYRVYIFAIIYLPFAGFFVGLYFYAILSSFDKINFGSIYGILLSVIFFYVNYLSKKEYENKKVLVGYNGIDGKEVTMSKLKEDINEIRDSRSVYRREVEK